MTHIFWDSNMFIYLWENDPVFGASTQALWKSMSAAKIGLVTSTLTLGEVMAGPRRSGDESLASQYRAAIQHTANIIHFDERAADIFATVRAQTRIKQPDAIQLACASIHGVELFVTNDTDLQKLRLPGIHFIVSIQTALNLLA